MTAAAWYTPRSSQPGASVLAEWIANRPGAAQRAGLAGVQNATRLVTTSDPEIIELLGARASAAGVYVSPETAMAVSAVYACVSKIVGGIATLPCHVYERTWDAERQEYSRRRVDDANLWWLLNEQPTAAYSAALHWEQAVTHELLRGDSFSEIRRDKSGRIREIVPLPWSSVTPDRMTEEVGSRLIYAVNDGLRVRGVDQDDMLHIPGLGFDGLRGKSVISQAARNAAGNALAMDEYSGRFFAGGAHPSIAVKAPGRVSPELQEQMRQGWQKTYGGVQNAFRYPLILSEGLDIKELTMNAKDSQLLEARQFQVVDVARAFGVPPHMIGETSSSTSWGSGIEQMNIGFVLYTLQPHLVRIEQELNRKLFPRSARYFVEFDRDALLQGDSQAQANYFKGALGGPGAGPGWMSVNEIRRKKNLPPVEGGDTLFRPETKAAAPGQPAKEPA